VPNLDERVALLEGRVQEQATHMTDLRGTNADLRQEVRDLRQDLKQVAGELRAEMRHFRDDMHRRFDAMDRRFETGDHRVETVDHRFAWLVGLTLTGFLAVLGTIAGAFWGLFRALN
jgi:uncharacterized coiled-coil protein SlyX